jgi:hypothetical protein
VGDRDLPVTRQWFLEGACPIRPIEEIIRRGNLDGSEIAAGLSEADPGVGDRGWMN